MYFMLKGLPFIYQGQEIGMENNDFVSIDEIDDVSSKEEYRRSLEAGLCEKEALEIVNHYSRDNGRTPFHWNAEENAGFTTGTPWLVVNQKYKTINVEEQSKREDSVLAFYKKLIALRKDERYAQTVVYGETEPILENDENIMAYLRKGEGQTILVIGNFDKEEREVSCKEVTKALKKGAKILLNNCTDYQLKEERIVLKPNQALVLVN